MLLTIEKVIILKAVGIFQYTPEEVLVDLASILEETTAERDEMIFDVGEVGSSMYVIVNGNVRVHVGDHTIARLGPREVFGELAALDPGPRMAAVTAVEPAQLFRIQHDSLYELMAADVEFARAVIQVLCTRLRTSQGSGLVG